MHPAIIISAGATFAFIVLMTGLTYFIKRLRARGQAAIHQRYPTGVKLSETFAQSYGQQSLGVTQMRGNGALALTDSELFFMLYVPERPLQIPISSIKAVTIARRHLGKAGGANLLHVRFTTEAGEDAIAWRVPNVDQWVSKLGSLVK